MIVVTGGAGFIGSCIIARLNSFGWSEIIVVDHLPNGVESSENLKKKKYVQYLDKADFLKAVESDTVDAKVEIVIHMGACSDTTGTDAKYYEENNFLYTKRLAQWCLKKNVRFIYASSAATYGDGQQGYCDDEATIRKLKPLNLYGESKHKFDLWALDQKVTDRMVGLKFFNVFGPNEYHKGQMRSVVAKSYTTLQKEGHISLFKSYRPEFKDGEQKRDFIYVKDAVDVVVYFMENPQINGIFNLGTGQAQTWNDLAKALFASVGRELKIEYIEMPEQLRSQYQYFTQADMDKLRRSGYTKSFMSLNDAVKDYVGYLKNNSTY
ncbi:MAG: ADP-glyceromanno-heptose 6-epimerase [Candidatus Omnitrophica bacterium]|nr:ADP-glyceromanno-heptose 6-epimerase [Candidatus Omnitrophota bacterium]